MIIAKKNKSNGFTILEMLVVLAIAGMILSAALISITNVRMKSRDSRREADVKQLQNALSLYANNMGFYPICSGEVIVGGSGDSCVGPVLVAEGFLQGGSPQIDPLSGTSGTCGVVDNYVYCYQSGGSFYTIRYALESNGIPGKIAGWQSVGP